MVRDVEWRIQEMKRLGVKIMASDLTIWVSKDEFTPEKRKFLEQNGYRFNESDSINVIGKKSHDPEPIYENGVMKVIITK